MSKKENTNTSITAMPPAREWDGPAHATLESVIIGSTDKALGVGVMDATGKDGATTGYLVSLARTRPNGKKVIYPLQDLVKDMPKVFARTYNKYTQLYKTRLQALHKCAELAGEFNWEILDDEKSEIENLKASGQWEMTKTEKKTAKTDNERNSEASKRAASAINTAPSPFGALLDTLAGAGVMGNRESLIVPLLRVIHNAVTIDYSIIKKIVRAACDAIIAEGEKTAATGKGENKAA